MESNRGKVATHAQSGLTGVLHRAPAGNIKCRHNTFLDLTKTVQTEGMVRVQTFSTRARPSKNGAKKKKKKRSSSHQLTLSRLFLSPGSGDACARGQPFWKITRNSFPPWMENNKGIPHDGASLPVICRPQVNSSINSQTLLLLFLPSSQTDSQSSRQVIPLTDYRWAGSRWRGTNTEREREMLQRAGFGEENAAVHTIKYSVWLLFTRRFLT